jgi:molybdenum cofactor cytidylyltransferase
VKAGDFPLADMLEQEGCYVTPFRDAFHGMGASLAHGVSMARSADGWLVALADMPSVKSTTIAAVASALEAGASLVAPTYQGQRGHPVGFNKSFGADLLALSDDMGARRILRERAAELTLIECDDPGILHDIDQREDLLRAAGAARPDL